MRYICEIDVADNEGAAELYCGRNCDRYEIKETGRGGKPFCGLFRKELRLDSKPYEPSGVFRCDECLYSFYPAPEDV
jgi:hypothetical protein